MRQKSKFNIFKTSIRGYKKLVTDDYAQETKYLKSLSEADKEWLNTFISGYYFRNTQSFLKLNFTISQRRISYNRHRAILNDIYSRFVPIQLYENRGVDDDND